MYEHRVSKLTGRAYYEENDARMQTKRGHDVL